MKIDNKLVARTDGKYKHSDHKCDYTGDISKSEAILMKDEIMSVLQELQEKLYASARYSVLMIFQAMDAAGKDSTIKHVLSGINPQGCSVMSFKQPSATELRHNFLWRTNIQIPEKGIIGVFNRSYYEEVLITRVHPELLLNQNLPHIYELSDIKESLYEERYREINDMERYLTRNGTIVLKFFLNVSKKEQNKRFLERIEILEKNWKFSPTDLLEREHWAEYQDAYERCIAATSTEHAPWYVIPADNKWYTRHAISRILISRMEELNLKYPKVSEEVMQKLKHAKEFLLKEKEEEKDKKK